MYYSQKPHIKTENKNKQTERKYQKGIYRSNVIKHMNLHTGCNFLFVIFGKSFNLCLIFFPICKSRNSNNDFPIRL